MEYDKLRIVRQTVNMTKLTLEEKYDFISTELDRHYTLYDEGYRQRWIQDMISALEEKKELLEEHISKFKHYEED